MTELDAPTVEDWQARREAWRDRVAALGVERAVYHKKHRTPEAFAAITKLQEDTIFPVLRQALTPEDRVTLDFGCGHGRWTQKLADLTGTAIGVDPTRPLLETAIVNSRGSQNVTFALYENGTIPLVGMDGRIDVLWVCMVLSTILDDRMFAATLRELRRVCHPGTLVCLTDNTSMADGRPVRSPYSISRTIQEYQDAFASWVRLEPVADYQDFGEINTVFLGRVHA